MQNEQLMLNDGNSIDVALLRLLEHGLREQCVTMSDWHALFTGQKRQIAALIEAGFLIQRGDDVKVNRARCRQVWRYFGLSASTDWQDFVTGITDGRLHTTREIARHYPSGMMKLAHAHWLNAIRVEADTVAGRIYARGRG
jgi:hypothetical protein